MEYTRRGLRGNAVGRIHPAGAGVLRQVRFALQDLRAARCDCRPHDMAVHDERHNSNRGGTESEIEKAGEKSGTERAARKQKSGAEKPASRAY